MTLHYFDNLSYGGVSNIDVLLDPETQDLWVTIPVIERLLKWEPDNARKKLISKSLKAFAGNDLSLGKTVTAKDIKGRPNKIKAVPFDTFLKVVFWQATLKDETAIALLVAGFKDSFSSIILKQCGIEVSVEERNNTIFQYLTKYHEYQDWIRDEHVRIYGCKPTPDYYRKIAVIMNQGLFSRHNFKCDRIQHASQEQLREIECFERFAMKRTSRYPNQDPLKVTQALINDYT
jgi:hypothetical protein